MITALVKKAKRMNSIPSVIVNSKGLMRWSTAWENNPYILNTERTQGRKPSFTFNKNYNLIASGNGGGRHYINYEKSRHHAYYAWKEWDIEPGEIFLSDKEKEDASSFNNHFSAFCSKPIVLIEPTIKGQLQINKKWGQHNWKKLVELLDKQGIKSIQLFHFLSILVDPSFFMYKINSIREMFSCIAQADTFISHEGGFHHAAAALNIPGVVIFGGYISPKITGYDMHTNLVGSELIPQRITDFCGSLIPCQHCRDAMNSISPEMVLYETLKILEKKYG